MENSGYIKLHRQMLEWEWYDDLPTKVLFLHLLFKANWKDKKWHGVEVKRGQLITSQNNLAEETQLSRQQIRRAIDNLISTNEITKSTNAKYTIITVVKYNDYQLDNQVDNQQTTKSQPSSNQVATTTKERNKERNNNTIYINNNKSNILIKEKDKEKLKEKEREKEKVAKRGKDIPPSVDDVKAYCEERNNGIDAEYFCDFYQSKNWFVGKNKMKDWKACVRTWERNRKSKNLVGKNGNELLPENERDHSLDDIF